MLPPNKGLYVGHLGPIPLYVELSAVLLLYYVYLASGGQAYFNPVSFMLILCVLILGIVLHELGHGLVSKLMGASQVTITLWAFGGLCRSDREARPSRQIWILVAGPAVSFLLAGIGYLLLQWLSAQHPSWQGNQGYQGLIFEFVGFLFSVNLLLGIFNMLPIFPLDGGQIVYNAAIVITKRERLARRISLVLAMIGVIAVIGYMLYPDYSMDNLSNHIMNIALMGWVAFSAFRYLSWD
jgi:Zn-dependent protease